MPVEYFIKRITGDPSTFERFARFMIDRQNWSYVSEEYFSKMILLIPEEYVIKRITCGFHIWFGDHSTFEATIGEDASHAGCQGPATLSRSEMTMSINVYLSIY